VIRRARRVNFFMMFLFGLLSRKIIRDGRKRGGEYSFLFVHPDGRRLAEIGELLKAGRIYLVFRKTSAAVFRKRSRAFHLSSLVHWS